MKGPCHAPLSFSIPWSFLKFMSIKLVMLSNHLSLCCPILLLPSIFPSVRVFSNKSAHYSRWPKYWSFTSASVPPINIQGWFSIGSTRWISLQSKGLSGVFISTIMWSISSLELSFLYGPTLISVHDYWKNHSFDYMDLCRQNDVKMMSLSRFVIGLP